MPILRQIRIRIFLLTSRRVLYIVFIQERRYALTRSSFSDFERRRRSRLAQIAHTLRFVRGTLSARLGRCGKPNCHCARGELHASLYLVQSQGGKLHQLCVPKAWEARIRQAVENHQEMQTLIEELSQREWQRLRERKE